MSTRFPPVRRSALPPPRQTRPRARAAALAGITALLTAGGCAELPRDSNGSPPTYRLAPDAATGATGATGVTGASDAALTPQQKQRLDALNQQVLREQEAAIAQERQAEALARYYYAPAPAWSVYYGGWSGGRWGGSVGFGAPGYWGWGGYPYGWW